MASFEAYLAISFSAHDTSTFYTHTIKHRQRQQCTNRQSLYRLLVSPEQPCVAGDGDILRCLSEPRGDLVGHEMPSGLQAVERVFHRMHEGLSLHVVLQILLGEEHEQHLADITRFDVFAMVEGFVAFHNTGQGHWTNKAQEVRGEHTQRLAYTNP